jgi:hypothetical protein
VGLIVYVKLAKYRNLAIPWIIPVNIVSAKNKSASWTIKVGTVQLVLVVDENARNGYIVIGNGLSLKKLILRSQKN